MGKRLNTRAAISRTFSDCALGQPKIARSAATADKNVTRMTVTQVN